MTVSSAPSIATLLRYRLMAGTSPLLIPGPGVVVLLLVAIGSGGLVTLSVLVGSLYRTTTTADAGFTIFCIGRYRIALIGPILTSWGWTTNGFHLRFG